jgi:enoyl-CoA hydratase
VALACDIRLASDRARFGQPEVQLGIIPGSGATQRLPRLVGPGRARELVFSGDIIDAVEADRIGLVNRVVAASELTDRTFDLARRIASRSAFGLKMAKRALRMGQEVGLAAGLAYEALAEAAVFCHPDKEEGVEAFFAKRKPEFNKD